MGACIFFTYRRSGGTTHWQQQVYIVNSLLVAVSSVWRGEGVALRRMDWACMAVTAVSMPLWYALTAAYGDTPAAAIPVFLLLMLADMAGFAPVVEKSWNRPETENRTSWLLGCAGAMLNLKAVTGWGIADLVWNGWMVGAQVTIAAMLFLRPRSAPNPSET
jgi:hypothetical protein